MSAFGPSRQFATPQQLGRFRDEADIQRDFMRHGCCDPEALAESSAGQHAGAQ